VISWAQNYRVFKDLDYAFEPAFFNRCDEAERPIVAEYYQPGHGKNPEFAQQGPVMRATLITYMGHRERPQRRWTKECEKTATYKHGRS